MNTRNDDKPVVFVIPGDLHLTTADQDNYRTALWMVHEINERVRPDFVQFIGDNVQHARDEEFELFRTVRQQLRVPHHVLVGDHDVHLDPIAARFRRHVGDPSGAYMFGDFHFIRLNTLEHQPVGISDEQLGWFADEIETARGQGKKVVVFQHHYPFKVFEQFSGPGLCRWREIVQRQPDVAIFTGHTHYGQIANDGRNVYVTTRSIGDPEGGPPGFSLGYLRGKDLAITYRTFCDTAPIALITHPRDSLLATGPQHIVSQDDDCRVRVWHDRPIAKIVGRLDSTDASCLVPIGKDEWKYPLPVSLLSKGEHRFEAEISDNQGQTTRTAVTFLFDPTGRYTPIPRSWPEVKSTNFC